MSSSAAQGRRRDPSDRVSSALADVAATMLAALSVPEVLARVTWGARQLTGARRAAVLAYEPSSGTLFTVAGSGLRERGLHARVRLHESRAAAAAILDRTPARTAPARGDALALALEMDPLVCIPLGSATATFGALALEPSSFDGGLETELQFAALASTAIENARAHGQARTPPLLAQASSVARDLHDTVAQSLYAVSENARAALGQGSAEEMRAALVRIGATAVTAAGDLRRAVAALGGGSHWLLGLAPAIGELAADARERGVEVEVHVDDSTAGVGPVVTEALYRACREGLANAQRHGRATWCRVRCSVHGDLAVAVVDDDGVGPSTPTGGAHFGLRFLREIADILGGSVDLTPRLPHGATLTLSVPVPQQPAGVA